MVAQALAHLCHVVSLTVVVVCDVLDALVRLLRASARLSAASLRGGARSWVLGMRLMNRERPRPARLFTYNWTEGIRMTDRSLWPPQASTVLAFSATVVAAAVMLVLVDQNRDMRDELAARRTAPATISAGAKVPDIDLVSLAGKRQSLYAAAEDGPVVVAFMTTTCPGCERNIEAWNRLSDELARGEFRVISLDGPAATAAYREEHELSWEFLRGDNVSWPRDIGVRGVPTTLVLGPRGSVLRAEEGALSETDLGLIVESVAGPAVRAR